MKTRTVILTGKRTPIGCFMGSLQRIPAPLLLSHCISKLPRALLEKAQVSVFGCSAGGLGMSPGKQALLAGGVSASLPVFSVDLGHSSGLKALAICTQHINLGSEAGVCGGMQNSSMAPYLLKGRKGVMGNQKLEDSLVSDTCSYEGKHEGFLVEKANAELNISRGEQDEYAYDSYKFRDVAVNMDFFKDEIAGIKELENDEEVGKVTQSSINPAPLYYKGGTVTAINSGLPGDGACALGVCSLSFAQKIGVEPLAEVVGFSEVGCSHFEFPKASSKATLKLMKELGWSVSEVDLFDINDYFSTNSLAFSKELGIPLSKINVNSGTVALGDPIHTTGARQALTLARSLKQRGLLKGVAVSPHILGAIAVAISSYN